MSRIAFVAGLGVMLLASVGCTEDPLYIQPVSTIEVNAPGSTVNTATAQLTLPVRSEFEDDEITEREDLAAELGVAETDIPWPSREDIDVSIEWTIRNLSDQNGTIRIDINGANEYFEYVPALFVVDPDEMEEPPPLMGDVPLMVDAGQTISGVFREDQLQEASIDLDLISRAEPVLSPFEALLAIHEDMQEFVLTGGVTVPKELFAHMTRFDITLESDRHMVMEFAVRVRDHRDPNLIVDECLNEEDVLNQTPDCTGLRVFTPTTIDPYGLAGMM